MFVSHGKETENNDTKPSNSTENEENESDELDSLNISTSFYGKMAYPIEIWAQSSLNAVLAIFCNLMWTAALLAGEIEKTTDFGVEPLGNNEEDGPSLELEKWMNQFELIINFIEDINDCFGHILALTLLHTFSFTSRELFWFFSIECNNQTFNDFFIYGYGQIIYPCFRTLIILIASYQLQLKVILSNFHKYKY